MTWKAGAVLLAAGGSSRMGKPKQLIPWKGVPLINHFLKMIAGLPVTERTVILGGNREQILPVIDKDIPVKIIINEEWKDGLSSSVRCAVENAADMDALLFITVDQPAVTWSFLKNLLQAAEGNSKALEVSVYEEKKGIPVVFGSEWFSELLKLEGDRGAREIIRQNPKKINLHLLERGEIDLDRPEDVDRLNSFGDPTSP